MPSKKRGAKVVDPPGPGAGPSIQSSEGHNEASARSRIQANPLVEPVATRQTRQVPLRPHRDRRYFDLVALAAGSTLSPPICSCHWTIFER